MRRTTPLTAAAMLGLTPIAPTTSVIAAGETCRGDGPVTTGWSAVAAAMGPRWRRPRHVPGRAAYELRALSTVRD